MTPRAGLLKIFRRDKPDRVPWFGDLDYWATALIARGERTKDFKTSREYLDWHKDLGVGFYLQGYFTSIVNDDEFNGHLKAILSVMRRIPIYVLGVADQVPPNALEYRVRRVSELVDKCGIYE